MSKYSLIFLLGIVYLNIDIVIAHGEVIYAINAGGYSHTDVHGIHYVRDPLTDEDIGTASDYGRNLVIARVPPADQILYQTERYHDSAFGYDLPLKGDGDYVVVLKFAEVYFSAPDQKVFSVNLNGVTVIPDLDIFAAVGRGAAHQEMVPFSLQGRNLKLVDGTKTTLSGHNKSIRLEFLKGFRDNPKINAVYIIKGTSHDVPQLPPFPPEEEPEVIHEEESKPQISGEPPKRVLSGPRTPDPYTTDESTGTFLPLLAAIGAAIPIVFCLCKM